VTGLALLASPTTVGLLLFGATPDSTGSAIGRLGGITLVFFALASWLPGGSSTVGRRPNILMAGFQAAVAVCLAAIGWWTALAGILLVPAVTYHVAAFILLTVGLLYERSA